ncbi:MAG TPA: GNAT family N-acetyltransferase [Spirochaetota bacterium]|nr:GNAT family N-acetyltransferase [Spirochaetota bacterium]
MLVEKPTQEQWSELKRNCIDGQDNIKHLTDYGYAGIRIAGDDLFEWMRGTQYPARVWLIEEDGNIVGFLDFGEVVSGHVNAAGVCIGLKYVRHGYARMNMLEFFEWCKKNGIHEANGYCDRNNEGSIKLMQSLGMQQQPDFRDKRDPATVRFSKRID